MPTHAHPAARLALAAAIAGACLLTMLGLAAAPASAASTRVQARVQAGTVEITGTAKADTLRLQVAPGAPAALLVDVGADGTAEFRFEAGTFTAITVRARDGADTITAFGGLAALGRLTIHGGPGSDSLSGGDGDDVLFGGAGNDTVIGARGNDTAFLGAGDDRLTWNPGDRDDTIEGQAGADVLGFNGANIAELFEIAASGSRARLHRDSANVTMDLGAVEHLELNTLGGPDFISVGDLTGTDLEATDIDLSGSFGGGDSQADQVVVAGTDRADRIRVRRSGSRVLTTGLAAQIRIAGSEAVTDGLLIQALAGNDDVSVGADVTDLIRSTVDLGADE